LRELFSAESSFNEPLHFNGNRSSSFFVDTPFPGQTNQAMFRKVLTPSSQGLYGATVFFGSRLPHLGGWLSNLQQWSDDFACFTSPQLTVHTLDVCTQSREYTLKRKSYAFAPLSCVFWQRESSQEATSLIWL
jgi:hypothetical protein